MGWRIAWFRQFWRPCVMYGEIRDAWILTRLGGVRIQLLCCNFRHDVLSRLTKAGYAHLNFLNGDITSPIFGTFNASPVLPTTHLTLDFQVRRAQRHLSSRESPRDHRCAYCTSTRQWDDSKPLRRCKTPTEFLRIGDNLGGDYGEDEGGRGQDPTVNKGVTGNCSE